MKSTRTIRRIAHVILNPLKMLGGNWSAVVSLVMSGFEMYEVLRRPELSVT